MKLNRNKNKSKEIVHLKLSQIAHVGDMNETEKNEADTIETMRKREAQKEGDNQPEFSVKICQKLNDEIIDVRETNKPIVPETKPTVNIEFKSIQ